MAQVPITDKILRFFTSYCLIPVLIVLTPFARFYSICTQSGFLDRLKVASANPTSKQYNNAKVHKTKVEYVIQQLIAWNTAGRKTRLCTGRKTWKTFTIHSMPKTSQFTQIDLSQLDDIVEINTVENTLTVEPGIMMGRLTSILLSLGYTIPVVPELDQLSVGGLVCGAGLETSSYKYGLFSDMCISYEVVLSTGEVVTCSKDDNSDLFYAIPMSYGTIGFVTAVKMPLIVASKFVKVKYVPVKSDTEAIEMLSKYENNNGTASNRTIENQGDGDDNEPDFIEAITFGPNNWILMFGQMLNNVDSKRVNKINRWYKPWFFKHVESIGNTGQPTTEYIGLRDYYHRHTRGYFWEALPPFPYGNNKIFLWLLGWVFPLNFQIVKLIVPQFILDIYYVRNHAVQDFVIPLRHLAKSLKFLDDLVQVYPLWICPCKGFKKVGMSGLGLDEMFIDIGVYGDTPKVKDYDPVKTTKKMESFTIQHNGTQALYADSYLTRDAFKKMFDTRHYYKIRQELKVEDAFPDVYDKISHTARRIKTTD